MQPAVKPCGALTCVCSGAAYGATGTQRRSRAPPIQVCTPTLGSTSSAPAQVLPLSFAPPLACMRRSSVDFRCSRTCGTCMHMRKAVQHLRRTCMHMRKAVQHLSSTCMHTHKAVQHLRSTCMHTRKAVQHLRSTCMHTCDAAQHLRSTLTSKILLVRSQGRQHQLWSRDQFNRGNCPSAGSCACESEGSSSPLMCAPAPSSGFASMLKTQPQGQNKRVDIASSWVLSLFIPYK